MNCFFYDKIYPLIKTFALNANLYYCSLFLFAFCLAAGVGKLFACFISSKIRAKSTGGLLAFYIFAFAFDAFFCIAESEFRGEYFLSSASAYLYCFVKFGVLTVFYIFVAFVAALLRFSDCRKYACDEEEDVRAKNRRICGYYESSGDCGNREEAFSSAPRVISGDNLQHGYVGLSGSFFDGAPGGSFCGAPQSAEKKPGEKLFDLMPEICDKEESRKNGEPCSVRILKRLKEEDESEKKGSFPDINQAYIISLAERIKKSAKTETEREKAEELLFELKYPRTIDNNVSYLNEMLNFLIKTAVDNGIDA